MKQSVLAVLLFGTALSGQTVSPAPVTDVSLVFQGVRLTLGMREASVRAELRDFRLAALPTTIPGGWEITTKSGPPFFLLGSVTFEAGTLVAASAVWDKPDAHKDSDLAGALYSALSSLARSGEAGCVIDTSSPPEQPGFEIKSASIRCGHRAVTVMVSQGSRYGDSCSVQERIFRGR